MDTPTQYPVGLGRDEDRQRDEEMRAFALRAEEVLREEGKLDIEIQARIEIDKRVSELVSEPVPA